jgi:hypothetical protein
LRKKKADSRWLEATGYKTRTTSQPTAINDFTASNGGCARSTRAISGKKRGNSRDETKLLTSSLYLICHIIISKGALIQ